MGEPYSRSWPEICLRRRIFAGAVTFPRNAVDGRVFLHNVNYSDLHSTNATRTHEERPEITSYLVKREMLLVCGSPCAKHSSMVITVLYSSQLSHVASRAKHK